jgi:hypothetical protein
MVTGIARLTYNKLQAYIKKICPNAQFGYDNFGQIIVKTNLQVSSEANKRDEVYVEPWDSCPDSTEPTKIFTVPELRDAITHEVVSFAELEVGLTEYYNCWHTSIQSKVALTLGPHHRLVYAPWDNTVVPSLQER